MASVYDHIKNNKIKAFKSLFLQQKSWLDYNEVDGDGWLLINYAAACN